MNSIANEEKYAKRCLEKKIINKTKNGKTIGAISKYLKQVCNMSYEEIYGTLKQFCYDTYARYDIEFLPDLINKVSDMPMNKVESVYITESELESIYTRDNDRERRVLFSMLVSLKVKNKIHNVDNTKVTESRTEIFKDAGVTKNADGRRTMMREFNQCGLIKSQMSGKSFDLLFVDEESPVIMTISDFENFMFDYIVYNNNIDIEFYNSLSQKQVKKMRLKKPVKFKLIECKDCGDRVLVNAKKTLYCKYCAEKRHQISDRNYHKKRYNSTIIS